MRANERCDDEGQRATRVTVRYGGGVVPSVPLRGCFAIRAADRREGRLRESCDPFLTSLVIINKKEKT